MPLLFALLMTLSYVSAFSIQFSAHSKVVHATALIYALYTATVFNLPIFYPIDLTNFNYSPIGVGVVSLVFSLWWYCDARYWFKGPRVIHIKDDPDETVMEFSFR